MHEAQGYTKKHPDCLNRTSYPPSLLPSCVSCHAGDYEARSLKVLKPSGTYVAFFAKINIVALLKG